VMGKGNSRSEKVALKCELLVRYRVYA
jgi:hypothetical protein